MPRHILETDSIRQLSGISDVAPEHGQILVFNDAIGEWAPSPAPETDVENTVYQRLLIRDEHNGVWEVRVESGQVVAEKPKPQLVSITNAGSVFTPDLPAGWQQGDLLLISYAGQSTSNVTIEGFDQLYTGSGSDSHNFRLFSRVLEPADGPGITITTSAGNRNFQMLLFRGARLLADEESNPVVDLLVGNDDAFPEISTLPGPGYALLAGSNYGESGQPGLDSEDAYTSQWNERSSQTRHRGYLAEVDDQVHEVEFSWVAVGSRYGMGRVVIVSSFV